MSSPSAHPETDRIVSFPLERPERWVRRREAPGKSTLLAYFIAGEENRLPAFVALADHAALNVGNPLLLIGPVGAGKTSLATHLAARLSHSRSGRTKYAKSGATRLQSTQDDHLGAEDSADAAGDFDSDVHPNRYASNPTPVLYFTAVDFARAYAQGLAADDLQPLREQIQRADVLVIDDLHLIRDKPAAQDELAMRLDRRIRDDLPTILTCRRLPSEIRSMRPLLASRSVPGLTVPIAIPAGQSRLQLIRELSLHHSVDLSEGLVQFLHRTIDQRLPARSLDAAIKQIALWCRMHDAPASQAALEHAIETFGKSEEISLPEITSVVARYFRLRRTDLRSSSRKQNLVRARSLAMLLGRRLTSLSMHQIGDYFGGRDHTTVLHAIRKTESLLEQEGELKRAAEEIQEKLAAA